MLGRATGQPAGALDDPITPPNSTWRARRATGQPAGALDDPRLACHMRRPLGHLPARPRCMPAAHGMQELLPPARLHRVCRLTIGHAGPRTGGRRPGAAKPQSACARSHANGRRLRRRRAAGRRPVPVGRSSREPAPAACSPLDRRRAAGRTRRGSAHVVRRAPRLAAGLPQACLRARAAAPRRAVRPCRRPILARQPAAGGGPAGWRRTPACAHSSAVGAECFIPWPCRNVYVIAARLGPPIRRRPHLAFRPLPCVRRMRAPTRGLRRRACRRHGEAICTGRRRCLGQPICWRPF